MDKITHQVRAEHWARIMNECINSGMSKTAWCRVNGISVKQFFYWQRILRREACFLQALFPQKCRVTSSKLHGEFPQYCISPSGTLLGAGEEPLQAYKVY